MKLTAEAVSQIVKECLPKDDSLTDEQKAKLEKGEVVDGYVTARGAVMGFCFVKSEIEKNRTEIEALLRQLPEQFMKDKGGGWSFLNACVTRADEQWGEHRNIDELICLGMALGVVSFQLPREMWPALPGGMPYFCVDIKAA